MRSVLLFSFLAFCFVGYGQIIDFPDANFKNALVNSKCAGYLENPYTYIDADLNNDGEIDVSEAQKVIGLKISIGSIISIKGLEHFINIENLDLSSNNIDTIIINSLHKIRVLDISYNEINYLELDSCIMLKTLILNSNPLKKENLRFYHPDSLDYFYFGSTLIDTFSLNFPNLTTLSCSNINYIDINKYDKLKSLTCTGYKSDVLDLRALHKLEFLNCEQGKIKKLKINGLDRLEYLRCFSNEIDSLDLRGKANLTDILCNSNEIKELYLSDCNSLENLKCYHNKLKSLDLSYCHKLENLSCYYNEIEYISTRNGVKEKFVIIHNIPLKYFCCDDDEIQYYTENLTSSTLGIFQIGTYCSFTPGGIFYTIQGQNIYDGTGNGCDDQDTKLSNPKYKITDGTLTGSFVSNTTGNYSIPVQVGTHIVTPIIEYPSAFDVTPSSFTVTFPTTSDTVTQDFCFTTKGVFRQTNITVIPLSPPARPGFDASYKIVWENVGNQIESGTLNFTYDETLLDYISATQTADLVADGIVKWNFSNLLPFEKREITVTLKVNRPTDTPAVNAGDKLYLTASILDNIFTLENTVVGSYDPNDKTCLQGDRVKPDMVGEYVDYLIRFENTGNFAAENVVVKDIIDTKTFDVSTLKITDASHEVYTRIEGNKVEFIFENIRLPFDDANNDGYIAFKIKTLPTLVLGDSLKNLANIYFDYNFPIRTNEAQTTVAFPVFTKDITTEVNIYPNPVNDILYLDTNDHWTKAEIFDISGRIIRSISLNGQSMDVSGLENGTYFIRLKDGEKVGLVQFVKI